MKYFGLVFLFVAALNAGARDCTKELCVETPESAAETAQASDMRGVADSQVEIECCYNFAPETAAAGKEGNATGATTVK